MRKKQKCSWKRQSNIKEIFQKLKREKVDDECPMLQGPDHRCFAAAAAR